MDIEVSPGHAAMHISKQSIRQEFQYSNLGIALIDQDVPRI